MGAAKGENRYYAFAECEIFACEITLLREILSFCGAECEIRPGGVPDPACLYSRPRCETRRETQVSGLSTRSVACDDGTRETRAESPTPHTRASRETQLTRSEESTTLRVSRDTLTRARTLTDVTLVGGH